MDLAYIPLLSTYHICLGLSFLTFEPITLSPTPAKENKTITVATSRNVETPNSQICLQDSVMDMCERRLGSVCEVAGKFT